MRIQGNISPSLVSFEPLANKIGYIELRLRENIVQLNENMFGYDEYVLRIKDRPGLQAEIEADMGNWLATGRALEFDSRSSEAADLTDEISAAESDMAALVEMIFENDLEVIG